MKKKIRLGYKAILVDNTTRFSVMGEPRSWLGLTERDFATTFFNALENKKYNPEHYIGRCFSADLLGEKFEWYLDLREGFEWEWPSELDIEGTTKDIRDFIVKFEKLLLNIIIWKEI